MTYLHLHLYLSVRPAVATSLFDIGDDATFVRCTSDATPCRLSCLAGTSIAGQDGIVPDDMAQLETALCIEPCTAPAILSLCHDVLLLEHRSATVQSIDRCATAERRHENAKQMPMCPGRTLAARSAASHSMYTAQQRVCKRVAHVFRLCSWVVVAAP